MVERREEVKDETWIGELEIVSSGSVDRVPTAQDRRSRELRSSIKLIGSNTCSTKRRPPVALTQSYISNLVYFKMIIT